MKPTILVCDDEDVLRSLVRETLGEDEYTIVEAGDGDEALALARSARPELVILDMMMPGRSGLEVLAELHGDASFIDTPVLMLTARAQAPDRGAALAAGVSRYLAKPFSPLELLAVVEDLLATSRHPR